jgi:hypothetical protein
LLHGRRPREVRSDDLAEHPLMSESIGAHRAAIAQTE